VLVQLIHQELYKHLGLKVNANLAVGQVNLADSTSNDWYITGVQLEAGTTASDFEFLPVDVNLQRCQRYYQKCTGGNYGEYVWNTTSIRCYGHISVQYRATPTDV
jgi:hypothetical protein